MRRIEIDDDVYAELESHAKGFEQPNDVLRRLLLGANSSHTGPPVQDSPSLDGALAGIVAKGLIRPGETLSHVQVRRGRRFVATVEADGWIKTDVSRYKDPSPALGKLTGTSLNGWHHWRHDRSGKRLSELRKDAGGAGRGGS